MVFHLYSGTHSKAINKCLKAKEKLELFGDGADINSEDVATTDYDKKRKRRATKQFSPQKKNLKVHLPLPLPPLEEKSPRKTPSLKETLSAPKDLTEEFEDAEGNLTDSSLVEPASNDGEVTSPSKFTTKGKERSPGKTK